MTFPNVAGIAACLVLAGCANDTVPSVVLYGPGVLTYHAPGVDFGSYRTYAIVNQVAIFTVTDEGPVYTFEQAPEVLAAIRQNMADRGYELVAIIDPTQPPLSPPPGDLAVNVVALRGRDFTYYPCDFWPWWQLPDFGCRIDWDWFPYRSGTLLVLLGDRVNAPPPSPDATIHQIWAAAGYSVFTPGAAANVSIAVTAVNQAFAQSPYLHTP